MPTETFVPERIDDETIRQVKRRIVEACDPEAIVLFGSVARAEHREESDLDLLVIVDLPAGKTNREQMRERSGLFPDRFVPMDLLVLTPDQYRESRHLLGHIALTAHREAFASMAESSSRRSSVRAWVEKASEDEELVAALPKCR
ncbi:MAG: hypothetical protein BRD30_02045 [Bacteroidetes bacterium QH_2_63_10]|jgi:predicted nucleotidyltransferase|nr:MAG: hypothetical protein BRD30_02045 [Bacteroidetes bacterium QH_2_63_10]